MRQYGLLTQIVAPHASHHRLWRAMRTNCKSDCHAFAPLSSFLPPKSMFLEPSARHHCPSSSCRAAKRRHHFGPVPSGICRGRALEVTSFGSLSLSSSIPSSGRWTPAVRSNGVAGAGNRADTSATKPRRQVSSLGPYSTSSSGGRRFRFRFPTAAVRSGNSRCGGSGRGRCGGQGGNGTQN